MITFLCSDINAHGGAQNREYDVFFFCLFKLIHNSKHGFTFSPINRRGLRQWRSWTAYSDKKLNVNKPCITSRKTALRKFCKISASFQDVTSFGKILKKLIANFGKILRKEKSDENSNRILEQIFYDLKKILSKL